MKKTEIISEVEKDFGVSLNKKKVFILSKIKGAYRTEKVLAAIYLLLKQKGYPISFVEFLKYAKSKGWVARKNALYTFIKRITSQFNLKNVSIDLDLLIEKYAKKLNYTKEEIEEAKRIAKILKKSGINPNALAASALYIVGFKSGRDVQQTQFSQIFGITETTIRVYFRKWREIEKKELFKSITT
jgi:transcription initiation factor TFIIIB Brf1 subunit/transcription initiation factor TFIIB